MKKGGLTQINTLLTIEYYSFFKLLNFKENNT